MLKCFPCVRSHACYLLFAGLLLTNLWYILVMIIEPGWWNRGGLEFHF